MCRVKRKNMFKFLQKGAGESLSFLLMCPVLILLFALLISIIQTGLLTERLEYIAYAACRKAVVQSSYEKGIAAANAFLEKEFPTDNIYYEKGSETIKLYIDGAESDDPSEYDKTDMKLWKKGNYVSCVVQATVKPVLVMVNGNRTASVNMMIENPASGEDGYPWFEWLKGK